MALAPKIVDNNASNRIHEHNRADFAKGHSDADLHFYGLWERALDAPKLARCPYRYGTGTRKGLDGRAS